MHALQVLFGNAAGSAMATDGMSQPGRGRKAYPDRQPPALSEGTAR